MNKKEFEVAKKLLEKVSYQKYIKVIRWYQTYFDDIVFEGTRYMTATNETGDILAVRVKMRTSPSFEINDYDYYLAKGYQEIYEKMDMTGIEATDVNYMVSGRGTNGENKAFIVNKKLR